ncbi:gluconokinase [Pseudochryseolinea flava]|uniref:Gluconokinase n=1 Tax=Pseudochryseolinea flava TaxID=2059302 RepID=A0A364Y5J5_9BACT|nr:gluconokinase [Pseudochryseolinea flava]RAW01631.1 gluconokinase [Pseudochryseolinea flava]
MKYFIGIDIGTGSTKAVSLNSKGEVIHIAQVPYPSIVPQPQHHEQDPNVIWNAFVTCIQNTIQELKHTPVAIALSSAMHSLICMDHNRNAVSNMITWADNRSASIAERIKNSALGDKLYTQTGTPIHAMSPLCKILWLKENDPTCFTNTSTFISIKEFIWFKLFETFEVDHSIASATGLFDLELRQWNETAMNLCGISINQLSTPVSTSFKRTLTNKLIAEKLSISTDTTFVIGASDGCMANLGSFAINPGIAALTIGTSGAIRVASPKPIFNFKAMTFNYHLDEETFISGGPINNGGVILKWYVQHFLKRALKSADDYHEIFDDLFETPAGANGLIFLPYLLGDRAPIWNSDACGVFFGISTQHTQSHFTRALLEGICLSLYHIGDALIESGLEIQEIRVSGGFVRSKEWLQLLADIFGKPIVLISTEDASAIGAVYMAMKSLGVIQDYHELKQPDPVIFKPQLDNHRVYQERIFPLYKNLYKNLMLDMAIWSDFQRMQHDDMVIAERK